MRSNRNQFGTPHRLGIWARRRKFVVDTLEHGISTAGGIVLVFIILPHTTIHIAVVCLHIARTHIIVNRLYVPSLRWSCCAAKFRRLDGWTSKLKGYAHECIPCYLYINI